MQADQPISGAFDRLVTDRLDGLLTVADAVRSERSQADLVRVIAECIASGLSYRTVVVCLRRGSSDELVAVECIGDPDARQRLLGQRSRLSDWQALLDQGRPVHGTYFLPAEGGEAVASRLPTYSAPGRSTRAAGAWHSEDSLIVPLRSAAGDILGMISVDEPTSRRRPSADELAVLGAFCAHLGSAIELSQLHAVARRRDRALARLAELSVETRDLCDLTGTLERLVSAARDTLALARVEITASAGASAGALLVRVGPAAGSAT